jgi:uncharacterized glyoxalase superfamily protein PhnB
MHIPPFCPEVPVTDLTAGLAYYRDRLGFTVDWADESLGLAGLSRGDARVFMSSADYRTWLGNKAPIVLWLNLDDRAAVDALHRSWAEAGVEVESAPAAKPYFLYEFFARDPDGNMLRIFYDFGWEERAATEAADG